MEAYLKGAQAQAREDAKKLLNCYFKQSDDYYEQISGADIPYHEFLLSQEEHEALKALAQVAD
jgi:hypothetical protein